MRAEPQRVANQADLFRDRQGTASLVVRAGSNEGHGDDPIDLSAYQPINIPASKGTVPTLATYQHTCSVMDKASFE